jgi:hypothetical protein
MICGTAAGTGPSRAMTAVQALFPVQECIGDDLR